MMLVRSMEALCRFGTTPPARGGRRHELAAVRALGSALMTLLLVLSVPAACAASGDVDPRVPPAPGASTREPPAEASGAGSSQEKREPSPPRVVACTANGKSCDSLSLGDAIHLEIDGLPRLMASSKERTEHLLLFLDEVELSRVKALPRTPRDGEKTTGTVRFVLGWHEEDRDAWAKLVTGVGGWLRSFPNIPVSVGFRGQGPISSEVGEVTLEPVAAEPKLAWLVAAGIFGIALFAAGRWTRLFRDPGQDPAPTYSLSRVQMGLWTVVVISSYLFLWGVTGDPNLMTASAVVLMGISASTAVGSRAISSSAAASNEAANAKNDADKTAVRKEIADLEAKAKEVPGDPLIHEKLGTQRTRLAELEARTPKRTGGQQSDSFIVDVLSGDGGASFHRLQVFAWTIALIVVFAATVLGSLEMPEFSETVLALTGISSGTYVGFKFTEPPK